MASPEINTANSNDGGSYSVDAVWTPVLARTRFVPVVRGFLDHYSDIVPQITNAEAVLLVHIIAYKWTDEAPWPSYTTLAKKMGTSPKMIQRYAKALEDKGYLRRIRKSRGQAFDLIPLFEALEKRVAAGEEVRSKEQTKARGRRGSRSPNQERVSRSNQG